MAHHGCVKHQADHNAINDACKTCNTQHATHNVRAPTRMARASSSSSGLGCASMGSAGSTRPDATEPAPMPTGASLGGLECTGSRLLRYLRNTSEYNKRKRALRMAITHANTADHALWRGHRNHAPLRIAHVHRPRAGRVCLVLRHRAVGEHDPAAVPLQLLHRRQRQRLLPQGRGAKVGHLAVLLLHRLQAQDFRGGAVDGGGPLEGPLGGIVAGRGGRCGALYRVQGERLCGGVLAAAVPGSREGRGGGCAQWCLRANAVQLRTWWGCAVLVEFFLAQQLGKLFDALGFGGGWGHRRRDCTGACVGVAW